eukprot:EST41913.1 Hypothetical protein SS50377_18217 [Spironucleus salmonicida]
MPLQMQVTTAAFLAQHHTTEQDASALSVYEMMFRFKFPHRLAVKLHTLLNPRIPINSPTAKPFAEILQPRLRSVISAPDLALLSPLLKSFFSTNQTAEILLIQTMQSTFQHIQKLKPYLTSINILKTDAPTLLRHKEAILQKIHNVQIKLLIIDNIFQILNNSDLELLDFLNQVSCCVVCFNSVTNLSIVPGTEMAIPENNENTIFSPFLDLDQDQLLPLLCKSQHFGVRLSGQLICGSFAGKLGGIFGVQVVQFRDILYIKGRVYYSLNFEGLERNNNYNEQQ